MLDKGSRVPSPRAISFLPPMVSNKSANDARDFRKPRPPTRFYRPISSLSIICAAGNTEAGGELSGLSCGHQKTTGRAPCDAQPGCERDRESLRVSGRFQPTTLKQAQRP